MKNIITIISVGATVFMSAPLTAISMIGQYATGDIDGGTSNVVGVLAGYTTEYVGGSSRAASLIGAGVGGLVESTATK